MNQSILVESQPAPCMCNLTRRPHLPSRSPGLATSTPILTPEYGRILASHPPSSPWLTPESNWSLGCRRESRTEVPVGCMQLSSSRMDRILHRFLLPSLQNFLNVEYAIHAQPEEPDPRVCSPPRPRPDLFVIPFGANKQVAGPLLPPSLFQVGFCCD